MQTPSQNINTNQIGYNGDNTNLQFFKGIRSH